MVKPEVDGIGAELDRPFNDAATSFLVAEDVPSGYSVTTVVW